MSSESDRRLTFSTFWESTFNRSFKLPPNPTTQNCYPNTQMDQSLKVFQKKTTFIFFFWIWCFFSHPFLLKQRVKVSTHTHKKHIFQGVSDPWDPGGGEGEEVPEPLEPPTAPEVEEDEVLLGCGVVV